MPFSIEMEVRDSEIDESRVVNNAYYLVYFQHARHLFLRQKMIDYSAFARMDIALVLVRAEIDFVRPLVSGNKFEVSVDGSLQSRTRIEVKQELFRLPDRQLCARLKGVVTAIKPGSRPFVPPELAALFEQC